MRTTRIWKMCVAGAALLSGVVACSSDDNSTSGTNAPSSTAAPTSDAAPGTDAVPGTDAAPDTTPPAPFEEGAILRVGTNLAVNQGVKALDPTLTNRTRDAIPMQMLYAPVMTYDWTDDTYTPYLAESVDVVDSRTVTVTLRGDAKFDDGRPVTAEDAKATLEKAAESRRAGVGAVLNPALAVLDTVTVDSPTTYTVTFSEDVGANIYPMLAGREFMIIPADAGPEQNDTPIGNGPFKFVSSTDGQRLIFAKSETFFDADKVHLGGIEFVSLVDGTPTANALLAGDIDITADPRSGGLDIAGFESIAANPDFQTASFAGGMTFNYIALCKSAGAVFEDPKVRVALMHALDRKTIADAVYRGLGTPAEQFWLPSSRNYNSDLDGTLDYDVDLAKSMLAEAGFQPGTKVNMTITSEITASRDIGLLVQQQWAEVGLDVNLVQTDSIVNDFTNPAKAGTPLPEIQSAATLYSLSNEQKLNTLFAVGAGNNTCAYEDPVLIDGMTKLRGLDPTSPEAVSLWHDLATHLAETQPIIPIVFNPMLYGWSDRVQGVEPNLLGFHGVTGSRYDLFTIAK